MINMSIRYDSQFVKYLFQITIYDSHKADLLIHNS